MTDVLRELGEVLEQRRNSASPDESYVAKLHHKGLNKILEKVGEECTETLIAAKDAERSGDNNDLIAETADLWFHSLVMLSHQGEGPEAVLNELARRFDLSGWKRRPGGQKTTDLFVSKRTGRSRTVRSQGWRRRAYRDVFTACSGTTCPLTNKRISNT